MSTGADMDYTALSLLRQNHAAWRMLCSEHAPLLASFCTVYSLCPTYAGARRPRGPKRWKINFMACANNLAGRRVEIDAEMARVLASDMALLDDTALKERFQQFMRRRASC